MQNVESFDNEDFELLPSHGRVMFDLTANNIESKNAERAQVIVEQLSHGIRVAMAANVYYRWLLGKQLISIRENALWRYIYAPGVTERPGSFNEWLETVFPLVASSGRHTAYNAINLAASAALEAAGEGYMRRLENLSNAYTITKAERRGTKITPAVLARAIEAPVLDFKNEVMQTVGPVRGQAGVVTDNQEQAKALTLIMARIKNAEAESLQTLSETIETIAAIAGDNPTDIVDFINAALLHETAATHEAEDQASRTSDVPMPEEVNDDDELPGIRG